MRDYIRRERAGSKLPLPVLAAFREALRQEAFRQEAQDDTHAVRTHRCI